MQFTMFLLQAIGGVILVVMIIVCVCDVWKYEHNKFIALAKGICLAFLVILVVIIMIAGTVLS